jgi:uncharacterized protein YbjT (DUF2867 family)
MSGERVLVTGGTGYLARWCIRLLLERAYDVHTTVRDQSAEAELRTLVGPGGPGGAGSGGGLGRWPGAAAGVLGGSAPRRRMEAGCGLM